MIWIFAIAILIAVAVLVVSTIYAILAADKLPKITGYKSDNDLKDAHSKLTWVSVIGSIGVFVVIVIFGLGIYLTFAKHDSKQEVKDSYAKHRSKIPLVLGLILLIVCVGLVFMAIFTSIAASEINRSNATGTRNAYNDALISTILSAATVVIIVLAIVLYFVLEHKMARNAEEKAKEEEEKKQLQMQQEAAGA